MEATSVVAEPLRSGAGIWAGCDSSEAVGSKSKPVQESVSILLGRIWARPSRCD